MDNGGLDSTHMENQEEEDDNYIAPIPDHYDQLFRVILIGESGVGKSSVLTRFKERDLSKGIVEVTSGVVFQHVLLTIDSQIIKLQLWDSGGQDRFRCITRLHYRKKDAFLLFYDVTDRFSFDSLPTWYAGMEEFIEENSVVILVANKCDNAVSRQVTREEGKRFAQVVNAPYIEVSAITGINVDAIFETTGRMLIARKAGCELPCNSIFV